MDISEKNLEATIEAVLLANGPDAGKAEDPSLVREELLSYGAAPAAAGGYRKRLPKQYDRSSCLIEDDVIDFVLATQPKAWEKLKKQYPTDAREKLLGNLARLLAERGTLAVLHKGITINGCAFRLAYFRPATSLNQETRRMYEANVFALVRQLAYSSRGNGELDLGIFLNGIPIFTVELKNPLTHQDAMDAVAQYRSSRDPREPLFAFGRCLAHFAVSTDEVYMTTHLRGPETHFLPFNKGNNGGRGNPPAFPAYATAYLWEEIWTRPSVLDLIQNFITRVHELDEKGRDIKGRERLIFPRYHQLDAVRRLREEARANGVGRRYLIQHSAGSGKSNSIVWLAFQLATLHDATDRRVFDSVIVITDRRILDRQLQRNMMLFEQTQGMVENIDTTSRKLREALQLGKNVIVCTLQKFFVIAAEMKDLAGERFAVIVDEAHSSQGKGTASESVTRVLTAGQSNALPEDDEEVASDDPARRAMNKRHIARNASYFAFTATPKRQTLELFGALGPDGKPAPFSLYSMRQAIEEGFILDVLKNYTTYTTYFRLLKKIEEDPELERMRAARLLKAYAESHPNAIAKKSAIMLEHFMSQVYERGLIGGRAKGMVVAGSRASAIRYKQAIDTMIKARAYPIKTLIAFSGAVNERRPGGEFGYTESGMNGFPDTQTAEAFKADEYRLLIVANKFQTGFDQPLLQVMYVDKKLSGVNAVQTLSRLNRIAPGKSETFVLDFVNKAEEILASFQPYYERTILSESTDPNILYDVEHRLLALGLHTTKDVEQVADAYYAPNSNQQRLQGAIDVVAERIGQAEPEKLAEYRSLLNAYAELYSYLAQIIPFVDVGLEKLFIFCDFLLRKLPGEKRGIPSGLERAVDMGSYTVKGTGSGAIKLKRGPAELDGISEPAPKPYDPDSARLSEILEELNERFGTEFGQSETFIPEMEARLDDDTSLAAIVALNSPDKNVLAFEKKIEQMVQDHIRKNFDFYKKFNDDTAFRDFLVAKLYERYLGRLGGAGAVGG